MPFGLSAPWQGRRPLVNLRADTLARRARPPEPCLVAADGWYEWEQREGERPPWFHSPGSPFFLAGVVEGGRFAVVTVDAAEGLRGIHERMPAVLPRGRELEWLRAPDAAALAPAELPHWRVGKAVGNVRAEGPALIERL